MVSENSLQIECAKIQRQIETLQAEVSRLGKERARVAPLAEAAKLKARVDSEAAFAKKQKDDKEKVREICVDTRRQVEELLDTFPDLDAKEFAGRYEVKDVEARLEEVYPASLIEGYSSIRPTVFDDEGEAYQAYSWLEQRVAMIKQHNLVGALFSGLTGLMEQAASYDKVGSKVALFVVGFMMLLTIFQPFLMLTIYSALGVASLSYGVFVSKILDQLYSVKQFLNDAYDEDIFQRDREDILEVVDDFLERTMDEYFADIDARRPQEPTASFQQIDAESAQKIAALDADIAAKQNNIQILAEQAKAKLQEYDKMVREREEAAASAKKQFLGTFNWEMKWPDLMFTDVVESRVQAIPWSKCNTVYTASSIEPLQTLGQLIIFQNVLHVHPSYSGQIVLDYKYMGGNLLPFSRLPGSVCDICTDEEKLNLKVNSIDADIRARCKNILQSCASIEDFNALMATYEANGESYVVVHIWGLSTIANNVRSFLKNGPKVGYFFKLYLTTEELTNVAKDFPFEDIQEYAEVSNKVIMRTAVQIKRMLETNP